jgi:hypothetical protein
MFGGMVVANTTKIIGAMDLAMPVSSAIVTSHPGVVNSISVIKGLLRRSAVISGGECTQWFWGCNGWFGVFLFNERGRRWCIWSG